MTPQQQDEGLVDFELAVAREAHRRMQERRDRIYRLLAYVFFVGIFTFTLYRVEQGIDKIEDEALARERQIKVESDKRDELIAQESFARGLANCEATNETRRGQLAFIEQVFPEPPRRSDQGQRIIDLARKAFPIRDCEAELIEAGKRGTGG
jgi:hypothetical protein